MVSERNTKHSAGTRRLGRKPAEGSASRDPAPLVGGGSLWSGFLDRLRRSAASGATVLLAGEHGVGKGFLARWVHQHSPRSAGPLVELDLSAGSPHLLESLLFGHEAGAFTGARGERLGAARRADGGTLVLRGIHELALELQVKLLRLLQERVVEPLGAEAPVPVDVRVIGTAAEDLAERVAQGRFREDLYYRLAVVVLEVPPLRVRFEEVQDWLPALVARAAERVGRRARPLSPGASEGLAALGWPGNVRQLENSLERALVLGSASQDSGGSRSGGEPNQPLGPGDFEFLTQARPRDGALEGLAKKALAQGVTMDQWDRALLATALAEHRGSLAAAARALGVTRKAFEYRWSKLGGSQANPDVQDAPPKP